VDQKIIFYFLFSIFSFQFSYGDIINYEAKGNLESKMPINCVDINKVNNFNTPADIFVGVSDCVNNERYQEAGKLLVLATTYGNYDTRRVEDRTAHQASPVLFKQLVTSIDEDRRKKLFTEFKNEVSNNKNICASIKKLGKPNYYPAYMIQHGMGAFLGKKSKDGLVSNFDPEYAWENTLKEFLNCTN